MAENSADIDKQTYGKGFPMQRSDMDELQLNVVGAVHRIQKQMVGHGSVLSVPSIVLEDPLTLNVKIGTAALIDGNGKAIAWNGVQTVSCSASTHGSVGSTAPNAIGSIRYIVVAAKHKFLDQEAKVDAEGVPYFWKQISSYELRVYQTGDIAAPDDALVSNTLKTLLSSIKNDDAAEPIVVVRRAQGASVLDNWMWVVLARIFLDGGNTTTQEVSRRIDLFSALPVIANDSGTVVVNPTAVPGNGGSVTIVGGEKVQIGWLDYTHTDIAGSYPMRIEVTVPAGVLATTVTNSVYMLRMYIDERTRQPILYVSNNTAGYLKDTDWGLLTHGTPAAANAGSRPTLIDIPLAEIKTGNSGVAPTVTLQNNSVRTANNVFLPWVIAPNPEWVNQEELGVSEAPPADLPNAVRLIVEDLSQKSNAVEEGENGAQTGSDRVGAAPVGAATVNRILDPLEAGTVSVQRMLSLIYLSQMWGRGLLPNVFHASLAIGQSIYYPGDHWVLQEMWQGGPDAITSSLSNVTGAHPTTQQTEMGELRWQLYCETAGANRGCWKIGTVVNVGTPTITKFGGILLKSAVNVTTMLFLGQIGQATAGVRTAINLAADDRWHMAIRDVQCLTSNGVNTVGRVMLGLTIPNIVDAGWNPTHLGASDYIEGMYFTTRPDLGANWYAVVKTLGTTTAVDTGVVAYSNTPRKLGILSPVAGKVVFTIDGVVVANTTMPGDIFTNRSYGLTLQAKERLNGAEVIGLYCGPIAFTLHA